MTVGRNLDRNGQTLFYLPYSDSFYTHLILILSHLLLFYSGYSYLFYSKTRWIIENIIRYDHLQLAIQENIVMYVYLACPIENIIQVTLLGGNVGKSSHTSNILLVIPW